MKKNSLFYRKTNYRDGFLSARECLWCNAKATEPKKDYPIMFNNGEYHGEIKISTGESGAIGFSIGFYICPIHKEKSVGDTHRRLYQLLKGWMG